ncbi:hypothetical protein [Pseudomonas phage D6]|nr:hypothetical protein [Pseudomonas phage D6]
MFEQLMSKAVLAEEEQGQTIFLYDPETNTDLMGSNSVITLYGTAALSDTIINGHKSLALPSTASGFKAVFPTPIDLQGKNWTLEWSFYNTTAAGAYASETCLNTGSGTGILSRWGDSGFGNRLQLGVRFSAVTDCWNPAMTKASSVNTEINMALSCKAGLVTVFRNGVKQGLANGTGGTYGAQTFPVSSVSLASLANLTIGYAGGGQPSQLGYHGRVRLSLGGRYTRNYTVVPLEVD